MNGKQRRHHGARRRPAGHLLQNEEKENRGGGVEQDVREMMSAGPLGAVDLAIEHVGEPAQRGPIGQLMIGECPLDCLPRQPALDDVVFVDALVVIQIDELVAGGLTKDEPDGQEQQTADRDHLGSAPDARVGGGERAVPADRPAFRTLPVRSRGVRLFWERGSGRFWRPATISPLVHRVGAATGGRLGSTRKVAAVGGPPRAGLPACRRSPTSIRLSSGGGGLRESARLGIRRGQRVEKLSRFFRA